MNMRVLVSSLAVLLGLLSTPWTAEACACDGPVPSSAALRTADVVFVGTIDQLVGLQWSGRLADGSIGGGITSGFSTATFKIDRMFRGSTTGGAIVTGEGTDCDEPFAVGQAWLVYANQRDGKITTHKCTRTRLLAEAAEDLKYLENRQQGRPQAIVFGDVFHQMIGSDGTITQQALFEALEVIAISSGQRFVVKTEKWGQYELVLPPGEFELWVERDGRAVTARTRIIVSDRDERSLSLSARYN